jgi:AcrR family transcriptional regulator
VSQAVATRTKTPPRPDTSRRSPASRPTDDELLDAARLEFSQTGYSGTTMDAVADRANCTKPTLYAHFGTKEGLYEAAVEREARALESWMFATYDSAPRLSGEEQVRRATMALFEYVDAQRDGFRLLFGFDSTPASPPANKTAASARVTDALTERVAGLIRGFRAEHGRQTGPSAELLAAVVVAMGIAGARQAVLVDRIDPLVAGDLAASLAQAALRHVSPPALDAVDRSARG